jgi:hypothetical protein
MRFKDKIYSLLFIPLIFFSCEGLFDFDVPDDPQQILNSLEGIEGAIIGVYDRGRFIHSSDDYSMYKLCHSDEIRLGTNLGDQSIFEQYATLKNFDASNKAIEEIWNGYYDGLSKTNRILSSADAIVIDESDADALRRKSKVIGEAYYFRAYFHLSLLERWDHIVLADRVFDDPGSAIILADSSDVYNLMISDLTQAINLLPDAEKGQPGKVSKGVARHLLSVVYMNMHMYSEAAIQAKHVIEDPAYELQDSVHLSDIFSCHIQHNLEIIFSWQFSPYDPDNPQRCSAQLSPAYDYIYGAYWSWENGGRAWSRLLPSDYYWTLFEENDLRLEAWHKRFWTYNIDIPVFDPLPPATSIGDTITPENFNGAEQNIDIHLLILPTSMKYWEDNCLGRQLEDAFGYRNIILYRVSQSYLIAAEALMRQGKIAEGQDYFNKIRARAGVGNIPLTENNLIDEQLRELGLEGHRYAFLKRLGILYDRVMEHCIDLEQVYQPYHTRWPIPQQFIDLTGVAQNEGY